MDIVYTILKPLASQAFENGANISVIAFSGGVFVSVKWYNDFIQYAEPVGLSILASLAVIKLVRIFLK